jgi:predicted DNA-binding antitoxin AbrB/MazE fold protein
MVVVIRAVYENGQFRPLEPVDLPEGQEATVTIDVQQERDTLKQLFGDRVEWSDPNDDRNAWVEEMAAEIDRAFQGEPPLSEIIIQDRGEG